MYSPIQEYEDSKYEDGSPISKYYPIGQQCGNLDYGDDSDQIMHPSSPSPSNGFVNGNAHYTLEHGQYRPSNSQVVHSFYGDTPNTSIHHIAYPSPQQSISRSFNTTGIWAAKVSQPQPLPSHGAAPRLSWGKPSPFPQSQDAGFASQHAFGSQTSFAIQQKEQAQDGRYHTAHKIRLRPVSELPDIYRSLFKFGVFNAVQSSCFNDVVHRSDNLVLSAPTGSGKTVLFELAIIRMLSRAKENNHPTKCVYMSPTKALCSERFRDWTAKFDPLGIKCCELTGDTVQFGKGVWGDAKNSSVIITTPEKWDSLTRNWKDHGHILATIQLFLVDEVHILNEARGSTLEVVVSRMKRNGTDVRFVLVSATVPNIQDIASWIGNEKRTGPALTFEFGEEFRPCQLTRHIYGVPRGKGQNDFAFNKTLDYRLFPLLQKHAVGKPMLVFCSTRNGVLATAQHLQKEYVDAEKKKQTVPWARPPRIDYIFHDQRLAELAAVGIGIHHAGLNLDDRRAIEDLYIRKVLRLVVSTSTLAVGVNLPAHMVVIKGVQTFQNNTTVEYSDLDIMQMLGRAGRPQFDKDGIAIILCESELEDKYRALVQGKTILESSLHSNLSEHLNSEIALGTISDLDSAKTWLRGSFLFQRIQQNPRFYALNKEENQTWEQRVDDLVMQSIEKLQQTQLVEYDSTERRGGGLASTEFGDIMSKFYIRQTTMGLILALPDHATLRDSLETLAASEEFSDIKLRISEKGPLNKLRQHNDIRFTIKKLEKPTDKVFLLIQSILGGISLNSPEYKSADSQPNLEALGIFRHASRISRAMVEVAIAKKLGGQIKSSLEVLRCLSAKAWEDRPVVLRQIEQIGEKSLKVLAEHGITSIESLRTQDTLRIETLLNRRPPFGLDLINSLKEFPQYSLQLTEVSVSVYQGAKPVEVAISIECGLKADWTKPQKGKKSKAIGASMTSILTVTSDMGYIDYRRIPTGSLRENKSFDITAELTKPSQSIMVMISCESMAGVMVNKSYKPAVPNQEYPTMHTRPLTSVEQDLEGLEDHPDFWNMDIEDEIVRADVKDLTSKCIVGDGRQTSNNASPMPDKLANGRFPCNHACKDKMRCRHLCCREGLDDPPRSKKRKLPDRASPERHSLGPSNASPASGATVSKRGDATEKPKVPRQRILDALESLHEKTNVASNLGLSKDKRIRLETSASMPNAPGKPKLKKKPPKLDIDFADIKDPKEPVADTLADFGDEDDLPEVFEILKPAGISQKQQGPSSDTDYSNPQLDALISSLPSDDAQGLSTPPRKRVRLQPPGIVSPAQHMSPIHERYVGNNGQLFLDEHEDGNLMHNELKSNQYMAGDLDVGFGLDWTSIDVAPSPQAPDTSGLSRQGSTAWTPSSAAEVVQTDLPHAEDSRNTSEVMEEPDEFAELEAWLYSGAVDIVNE